MTARAFSFISLCVIYFAGQTTSAPPQTSRYNIENQNIKYNQRYAPVPQQHIAYQQQFQRQPYGAFVSAPAVSPARAQKPVKAGSAAKKQTQDPKKNQVLKYVVKKPVAPAKQTPAKTSSAKSPPSKYREYLNTLFLWWYYNN